MGVDVYYSVTLRRAPYPYISLTLEEVEGRRVGEGVASSPFLPL